MTAAAKEIALASHQIPNLIAVASGKGGVGKTWFSITLSQSLARLGRRVLLVDGDLGLANVDVQLGLTPEHDLASVISGECALKDAIAPVDGGAAESGRGFDVLAGRSGSGALAALGRAELMSFSHMMATAAKHYDDVILDLGAGIEQPVRMLCGMAGRVFVVLTDEPTSLTDAYALVKVLSMRSETLRIEAVVNMADSQAQGRRTHRALAHACRSFLGREPALAGVVTRDKLVKEAIRQQAATISRYPQSVAGKETGLIANRISEEKV